MNVKLTHHEQKIFDLVKKYPDIIHDPVLRSEIAQKNGMTEKTLRNRIGELKRYGLVSQDSDVPDSNVGSNNKLIRTVLTFWNHRKFIVTNTFGIGLVALIISLILPKWYASEALILSSGAGKFNLISAISPLPVSDFGLSTINEDITNFIALLKSRSLKEHMVKKFDLIERYGQPDIEYAMEAFESKMELLVTDEGTLKITIIDKDPVIAKKMVEEALFTLDSLNKRLDSEQGRYNREFLETRLNENKRDLALAEEKLRQFQERTGILDFIAQVTSTLETKSKLYASEMEAFTQFYTQKIQAYTQLYSQKVDTEIRLVVARKTLSDVNPTVVQLKNILDEQENQLQVLSRELDSKFKEMFRSITPEELGLEIDPSVLLSFENLPSLGLENARLLREVELQKKIMEVLIPQYEQAKLEESKNVPTIQVVDRPKVAINKAKPKRAYIVIGAVIMAFFLSSMYVLIEDRIRYLVQLLKNN